MGAFLSYATATATRPLRKNEYLASVDIRRFLRRARFNRGPVHRVHMVTINIILILITLTRFYLVHRRGASNDSMEDAEDPVRARLDRRAESARRRYLNAKSCRSSTHKGRRMVLLLLRRLSGIKRGEII